jgi:hypothetical protein
METVPQTDKSTAQISYRLKIGLALTGRYLKRVKKGDEDKCR